MAKIILTMNGVILQEALLSKERVTIGRRPHNDIVIDDLAISGEHAVIVTMDGDSYLEDLDSTNGTRVNGQPIKKHFLQDGDVIELVPYELKYIAAGHVDRGASANHPTANAHAQAGQTAMIRILNGPNAGKEIKLTKLLTTIGRAGIQVAAITWQAQGYFLKHVEGTAHPIVNGKSIGDLAREMRHGDLIDLAGTLMEFVGLENV